MTAPVSILAKGTVVTRYALCLSIANGDPVAALEVAKSLYGEQSNIADICKTAVEAGSTNPIHWGNQLVAQMLANDAVEMTRTSSAVAKLNEVRKVQFNVKVPVFQNGATTYWAGQGAPKPLTQGSLNTASLEPRKIVGVVPVTSELVRRANSLAETLIRRMLMTGIGTLVDSSFLDSANVGVAGVQPPAITAGLTPLASSGNVPADLETLIGTFAGSLDTAAIITDPLTAVQIGLRSSGSNAVVVGARGGEAVGIPVFTSSGSPRSTSGGQLVLLDQSAVLMADEGIRLDFSEQAALQMVDNPAAGAQSLVSLWQNNLVAFLIERRLNWAAPLPGTVVLLNGALY